MPNDTPSNPGTLTRWLRLAAIVNGVALGLASVYAFLPLVAPSAPDTPAAERSKVPDFDCTPWHALPVQSGRVKPLQTFAHEAMRQITGRTRFEGHDPVAIVLAWWLTEGRGAGNYRLAIGLDWGPTEFTDWEQYPFILCDHPGLRTRIFKHARYTSSESPGNIYAKHISPADLRASPGFDELLAEVSAARQKLQGKAHLELSTVHLRAEEVGRRLLLYDQICGRAVTRLHTNALSSEQFIDVPQLTAVQNKPADAALEEFAKKLVVLPDPLLIVRVKWDEVWLSMQQLRRREGVPLERDIVPSFERLVDAYHSGDHKEFSDDARKCFVSLGYKLVPDFGFQFIELELTYNRLQPFLWSWIAMLAAALTLFTALMLSSRFTYFIGLTLYGLSLAAQIWGFYARISISGWAPVTNMYESVIFVAFVSAVFALVLELIYRKKVIALAGSAVATLALVLADQLPLALDPKISPMVPVLRTNYWLTIHVLTIVCGYAGGTLAWGLGNVSLALLAFSKGSRENLKMLSQFTYRAMQLAVVLLATGTFLGGWWAAEAWGRFWGWDPKEVGALIALVCYVIPLHARYIGWVKDFGLAVSAVLCFAAILLSWYVVNFVIAAGLHSYGFGGGGGEWVLWAGLLNLEWVFVAGLLYARKPRMEPVSS